MKKAFCSLVLTAIFIFPTFNNLLLASNKCRIEKIATGPCGVSVEKSQVSKECRQNFIENKNCSLELSRCNNSNNEPPAQETPVEKAPIQDTPAQETPVAETPSKDTPSQETPVEKIPFEEAPENVFNPSSFWNTPLSASEKIDPNSNSLVSELIANTQIAGSWINTTDFSTPYYEVDSNTPLNTVSIVQNGKTLDYTRLHQELQKGVPIPDTVSAAKGTDGHLTIYDQSTDTLYEFWQLRKVNDKWETSWGGILQNASKSDGVMPIVTNSTGGKEYWGATATSLAAIGGTIMLEEAQSGKINHALAVAIVRPKKSEFSLPALRTDGWWTGSNAIPEGQRFRFPPDIKINPNWSPMVKMMVEAIRDYGMIVRDQAGSVSFFAEDPTQYNLNQNPYNELYGGLPLWKMMSDQFPWAELVALEN